MNVKKAIIYLAVSLCLGLWGCLREGMDDCPADMTLSFYLEDIYVPGTYDTRIGNDVQLYVFRDKKLIKGIRIPYSQISNGKSCTVRKTQEMNGDIDLVAWAVPIANPEENIPEWEYGEMLDEELISEELTTQYNSYYSSVPHELYLGRSAFTESYNQSSHHRIGMIYAACRVEVYVIDWGKIIYEPGVQNYAVVKGVMSKMDMEFRGFGEEANVVAQLNDTSDDHTHYATGRFGVMPSAADKTISVDVRTIQNVYATLSVPKDNLPRGAWAGGLIVFEYVMGNNFFTVIVDGWRRNISIDNTI